MLALLSIIIEMSCVMGFFAVELVLAPWPAIEKDDNGGVDGVQKIWDMAIESKTTAALFAEQTGATAAASCRMQLQKVFRIADIWRNRKYKFFSFSSQHLKIYHRSTINNRLYNLLPNKL